MVVYNTAHKNTEDCKEIADTALAKHQTPNIVALKARSRHTNQRVVGTLVCVLDFLKEVTELPSAYRVKIQRTH